MKISTVNNTDFKGVNTKQAHSVLLSRLNNPKRYLQYKHFATIEDKKDYDIVLSSRGKCSLEATVYDGDRILFAMKENKLNGIFNINPIRFLKKVANAAENACTSISKAEV